MRGRVGECACDMLHARARFALVPSIVAHVAGVCAFVCRILAAPPWRRKATIVMRTKKESEISGRSGKKEAISQKRKAKKRFQKRILGRL